MSVVGDVMVPLARCVQEGCWADPVEEWIDARTDVVDALCRMQFDYTAVLAVYEGSVLIGAISQKDLVRAVNSAGEQATQVGDPMAEPSFRREGR